MKKTITLLMLFIASYVTAQTVVSDTIVNLNYSNHNTPDTFLLVNDPGATIISYTTSSALSYSLNLDSSTTNNTGKISLSINMSQVIAGANAPIDSIKIRTHVYTNYGGTINGIPYPTFVDTLVFIQDTGNIVFNIKIPLGGHIFIESFYVIAYSHNTTTSINSFSKRNLNIFTYNDLIKTDNVLVNSTIKVINSLGQIVFESVLKDEIQTNLQTGIYTIQVLNSNEIIETKKCVLINNQ